jgi:hypothetical protein
LDENAAEIDVEGDDIQHFDPHLWKLNEPPDTNNIPFLGKSGPHHSLNSGALPFEYFCLFIPIYYWDRCTLCLHMGLFVTLHGLPKELCMY